ncbi:AzlC family ABC transporter permease [Alkaliphilus peptidifermentans]|uniref:4-azaleucine resistance probable transporter AzlC n=1 Tax=Alkaliphilus peptidifermentans DSM 18978 TaxID=1120976 RepID=A0A1G5LCR4_9FIRM|nr:AzlC family ABC transporter permease [Alkaliphilus peptidifermentans]SCZ10108.1 4-azaleucine resistance probable transporter AzlC [Alkaliphilus peptidifermentans DSM 18978]
MKLDIKIISKYKEGIIAGAPIVVGYVPIAMTFGMLSKAVGITFLESIMFSVFVFAGASQFMALNLLVLGVGTWEIILATLLMNSRHLLMSASLAAKVKGNIKKGLFFIAFGLTDETFSVAIMKKGNMTTDYLLPLELEAYLGWIGGTLIGYLVGEILPQLLRNSMGVALYAMFAAILIPEAKKSKKVALLAISAGVLNTLLNYFKLFSSGWNLIIAIVLISAAGVYFTREGVKAYE